MKATAILSILKALFEMVDEDKLMKIADKVLDIIENAVESSENEYDNAIILPLCETARKAFGIEDNDE